MGETGTGAEGGRGEVGDRDEDGEFYEEDRGCCGKVGAVVGQGAEVDSFAEAGGEVGFLRLCI